jgi:hypothetical protein
MSDARRCTLVVMGGIGTPAYLQPFTLDRPKRETWDQRLSDRLQQFGDLLSPFRDQVRGPLEIEIGSSKSVSH